MADADLDLAGSRILVIDDELEQLDPLCRALEEVDYEIQVASGGEEGLEIAMRTRPDLILLDVMMPEIDGYETCRRLKQREETRDIPVIFLTALDETQHVVEGFQAGGVDYVRKPFHKEDLLIRVESHLERGRLIRALDEKTRNLADLNAQLEQQVDERTRDLQLRVKELESKDRIAQNLLKVHTLTDTLDLVLEGVTQVVDPDRAVIYLAEGGTFEPAAAFLRSKGILAREGLRPLMPSVVLQSAMETARQGRAVVEVGNDEEPAGVLIPILREEDVLGFIEVSRDRPIASGERHALAGFALQAAVAISDEQMALETGPWQEQLKEAYRPPGDAEGSEL